MAINTRILSGNINPYSQNAVVFDTQPVVAFQLQQEAQKKAANEALEKHFIDMQNIDDKGVRVADTEGIVGKKNNLAGMYMQDRDKILHPEKDGGLAYNRYKQAVNELKGHINVSLREKENDKSIADDLAKKKLAGEELTPQEMQIVASRQNSIFDDKFYKDPITKKTWNREDVELVRKPFKPDEFTKQILGDNKMGDEIITGRSITKDDLVKTPTEKRFAKEHYNNILANAEIQYDINPTAKRFADNEIYKQPNFPKMNADFKAKMGRDIQTGKDALVAFAIQQIPERLAGERVDKRDKTKENMLYAHNLRGSGAAKAVNDELVQIRTSSEPLEKRHPFGTNENSADGGNWYKKGMKTAFLPPSLSNALSIQVADKDGNLVDVKPREVIISEDGKMFAPLIKAPQYQDQKSGLITEEAPVDWGKDKNIKKVMVVLKPKVWLTEKQMAAEIQKTYPKGEGNVDLGVDDENSFVNPENNTPKTSTNTKVAPKNVPKFKMN